MNDNMNKPISTKHQFSIINENQLDAEKNDHWWCHRELPQKITNNTRIGTTDGNDKNTEMVQMVNRKLKTEWEKKPK